MCSEKEIQELRKELEAVKAEVAKHERYLQAVKGLLAVHRTHIGTLADHAGIQLLPDDFADQFAAEF